MRVKIADNVKYIDDIVEIHMNAFKGFFLTFLGKGFLKQLYLGFMKHAHSDILIAVDNGNIVGFLAYSEDLSGFYKYLIKKRVFLFAWYAFLAFLRNPTILFRLFRAFTYSSGSKRNETYVELSSIGVSEQYRNRNVGSKLINYLFKTVKGSKFDYIKLETDRDDNEGANYFYQKNGFVLAHQYTTPENRRMNEYRLYLRESKTFEKNITGNRMRILYISTVFPKPDNNSTIYTDLAEFLAQEGHHVTVVATEEKKNVSFTGFSKERGCRILRVKTGNMYDVNIIEKGISVVSLSFFVKKAIKRNLPNEKYDLILFEAPPVTLAKVVEYAKKVYNAPAFLMMKDIFPQNAIDIGVLKKGIVYKYFCLKEKELYRIADMIGCMSKGNCEYIARHGKVSKNKLSIFPNTKKIRGLPSDCDVCEMRRKYGIPKDKIVFIFGGNMGKPQGMSYLCRAIRKLDGRDNDAYFVLVGRGTERNYVERMLVKCSNAIVLENLPRDEYEKLVLESDVGIISLDYRFTIPNYPSRILSYMEYAMPVLAATDKNTDFKNLIEAADCGLWCHSKSISDFVLAAEKLASDESIRKIKGINGRKYMEQHFSVDLSVKLLENFIAGFRE